MKVNIKLLNHQTVKKNIFSALNTLKFTIRGGITLLEKQKQIYDFQKNDFFEGRPTKPFSNGRSSKIKFEFEFGFNNEKIKFKKRISFFY